MLQALGIPSRGIARERAPATAGASLARGRIGASRVPSGRACDGQRALVGGVDVVALGQRAGTAALHTTPSLYRREFRGG